ncbi:putative ribonuclease H-like domain-containing protein [Tanacetum coccineum]
MLADSKLPTTFWAEAVNTACYVQNRVLVIKPHNKTPYELFNGRPPIISFMRPFGCPVTILNTLDHLGKFDGKADEGFFVGYSVNSKAFRVFNSRTRIVEETLHITFLENKPNVVGSGPEWLFDIDTLTKSMNYKPVVAGNQTNGNAGTKESIDAGQARKKIVPSHEYILLPLWTPDSPISSSPKRSDDEVADDAGKKSTKDPANEGDKDDQDLRDKFEREFERLFVQGKEDADNEPMMPNTGIFGNAYDDEDFVAGKDMNNLESSMSVSPIATTRVHKDHPVEQIIGDLHSAPQTRRMTKNSEEHVKPKKMIQALTDPSWIEAVTIRQFQVLEDIYTTRIVMKNSNPLNKPNEAIPEVNPVVPEPNQVVDIHDPNEMVDIPDDVDLVDYDGDDEENPEEDPEEDPEEEPEPNNGLVNQFAPHVDPHQPGVMIGWLEENDGVNEGVNNEDIEDEDVEIELDDDAELIFPYEVEGDKTLPHGGVSSNSKPPNAEPPNAESSDSVSSDSEGKVLESRENATSKKKLVKAEMKLELARMEHDMVERRLHAS